MTPPPPPLLLTPPPPSLPPTPPPAPPPPHFVDHAVRGVPERVISRPAASVSLPTRALARRKARESMGPEGGTPMCHSLVLPGQSCQSTAAQWCYIPIYVCICIPEYTCQHEHCVSFQVDYILLYHVTACCGSGEGLIGWAQSGSCTSIGTLPVARTPSLDRACLLAL